MKHKIAIVGEAWGEEEAKARMPFVGYSGLELTRMLQEAGIDRSQCYLTNVFNLKPEPTNDISNLCGTKSDAIPERGPLSSGKYIRAQYAGEIQRLENELQEIRPNIAIALGGTAAWALLGGGAISKIRGTISLGFGGIKVLPTYHPTAILRQWDLRHVTVLDLIKARRQAEYPEVRRPQRRIYIEPDLNDLEDFYEQFIRDTDRLSVDIETHGDQITCIGFAPSSRVALVIPITDPRRTGGSYWTTQEEEQYVWRYIRKLLQHPSRKTFQNGLYDLHFLWRQYGIATVNCEDDTMLLHHALQPESEKGLGFLGSVYTDEPAWKLMRTKTIKRDA